MVYTLVVEHTVVVVVAAEAGSDHKKEDNLENLRDNSVEGEDIRKVDKVENGEDVRRRKDGASTEDGVE